MFPGRKNYFYFQVIIQEDVFYLKKNIINEHVCAFMHFSWIHVYIIYFHSFFLIQRNVHIFYKSYHAYWH